jgi:hypothetical protein
MVGLQLLSWCMVSSQPSDYLPSFHFRYHYIVFCAVIAAIVFSYPFFMLSSLPSLIPSSNPDSRFRSILLTSFGLSSSALDRRSTCTVAQFFIGLLACFADLGRFPFNDSYGDEHSDLNSRLAGPITPTKAGARDSL